MMQNDITGVIHLVGLRTNFYMVYLSKPYNEWLRTYGPKCEKNQNLTSSHVARYMFPFCHKKLDQKFKQGSCCLTLIPTNT